MQQIATVWTALDPRRRIVVVLATVAMFATVLALSRMATAPTMTLLYSGLETGAAGDVINALEQRGVTYEVRGPAIYVDAAQRDQLRMTLASEGLPANSAAGYELLDNLSGFGTTSQMFDAAYWRAKEGELARTILASPHIRAARVHIATPSSKSFRRDLRPTASVSVTTGSGALTSAHAKALKFLVASSIPGLAPEDVSVIDGTSGSVIGGEDTPAAGAYGDDHAAQLRKNVARLLAARVGPGKAVVEVSVETVTDRESIVERRFDPQGRVVISTDNEERTTSSNDSGGSAVTVASNLPEGDGAEGSASSSSNSETRERVNFEVSETQREILRAPGAVKRLTVAVLLDGTRRIDASGTEVWEPMPDEEIAGLTELVESAVGYDEARGDVITVKSMPFEPLAPLGTVAAPGLLEQMNIDIMSLIQLAVLAVVGLVLGMFVVRPILLSPPRANLTELPPPAPVRQPGLTGEIEDAANPLPDLSVVSNGQGGMARLEDAPAKDPVQRLRNMIEERQVETVEILRSWMDEEEEKV